MNIKQLKEIIRMFEESSLVELEVNEGDENIRLKRKTEPAAPPP
ncbi:MAG TPA: acetyl-CoA carboxylase biotin carboxyl carrier protein, partial [Clostridiales bacterium]|nr:acetyl-CoA carboxylase biotin carboxyl carrier protein [Clostridiales bacterium]